MVGIYVGLNQAIISIVIDFRYYSIYPVDRSLIHRGSQHYGLKSRYQPKK
jgi:hypothetical protein